MDALYVCACVLASSLDPGYGGAIFFSACLPSSHERAG